LSNNVAEKVAPLIKEQNAIILDKTHILINDIISKNKDENIIKHINEVFKSLNTSISEETNKLISSNIDKKTFEDFINNIDNKFSYSLQNYQNIFSSSEQRLDTSIRDVKMSTENQLNYIKEISTSNYQNNNILNNNVSEILKKVEQENVIKHINETIKSLNASIAEENNKLVSSSINKQTFDEFINNIENKFASTLQVYHNAFSSTEQRLDNSIRDIKLSTENQLNYLKELSVSNHQTNNLLNNNVNELLKKMEISSNKGKISESILYNILQNIYPTAQIDHVGTQKETCDIILRRVGRPTLLIENKCWERTVSCEEISKFVHDIEKQNFCGLFLSQKCGIATKENFEINIHNNNVLLYVHEVNNDAEKIKVAINIIDHFKGKLDELSCNDEIETISKELLEQINREYQTHSMQKINLIKFIKDNTARTIKQIEDFNIPTLDSYLTKKFALSTNTNKYSCEFCQQFQGKNAQALSAHQRGCSSKKNNSQINISINTS
jgi:hypothetical protein